MTEYKNSNAGIIKSVPKTAENPYGILEVNHVPAGQPTIVALGGELTYIPRFANHYASQIKRVLQDANVVGANVYSVYYEFGARDAHTDRINLFRRAGRKLQNRNVNFKYIDAKTVLMAANEPTPQYLDVLYNAILKPIIIDDATGKPYDEQTITKNASLLRFYAHSHGGPTLTTLGQRMAKHLQDLGFSRAQIKNITGNIVVIQHGPITTLENPYFTTLSFASASDTRMDLFNEFSKHAYDEAANMYPSYFPQNGAHLFAAGQLMQNMTGEHDNIGLVEPQRLTDDGKVIFAAQRNAIVNSVRAALDGRPTPSVQELVSGDGVNWDELVNNGEWFYDNMLKEIKRQKQQNPKPDYQK